MARCTLLIEAMDLEEWTLAAWAALTGLSVRTLIRYREGDGVFNPGQREVRRLAKHTKLDPDEMRAAIIAASRSNLEEGKSSSFVGERLSPSGDTCVVPAAFEARSLSTLAMVLDESGYSAEDLAFLSGLEVERVYELWDDLQWAERACGDVLQSLVAAVPGIDVYLRELAIHGRIRTVAATLSDHGLELNWDAIAQLSADGLLDQYTAHALQAAVHIVRQDIKGTGAYLCRFWGQRQDQALGYAFRGVGGLLKDAGPLSAAAESLCSIMVTSTEPADGIAAANLVHHLAQTADVGSMRIDPSSRSLALVYRSRAIGDLIRSNDVDAARRYCLDVEASGVMRAVEEWAFPTYAGDCKATSDFSLPRSLLLKRTAAEIVRELGSYNEAYLHYLVTSGIPVALRRDPSFGGRRAELSNAVQSRLVPGLDSRTSKKAKELLASL